jgi:formyltetrahydrofolate synthetase
MLEVMSVDALNQDVADLHARIEAKVAAMANRRR